MTCIYMKGGEERDRLFKSVEAEKTEFEAQKRKLKSKVERVKKRELRSKAKNETLAEENTILRNELAKANRILRQQSDEDNCQSQSDDEAQPVTLHSREEDLDKTICQERFAGRISSDLENVDFQNTAQSVVEIIQKHLPEFAEKMPSSLEVYLMGCRSNNSLYLLQAMHLLCDKYIKSSQELSETKRYWSASPLGRMIIAQTEVASQSDTESSHDELY